MSGWLIAAVGVVYLVIGIDRALKGDTAMAVVFSGYAFSNIGLWMAAR